MSTPRERIGEMRDPATEIVPYLAGKQVARFIQREGADQANPTPRAEVAVRRLEHVLDPGQRIRAVAQRRKDIVLEPAIDMGNDGSRHLFLAAGKEVVEAALAEP